MSLLSITGFGATRNRGILAFANLNLVLDVIAPSDYESIRI